MEDRRSLLPPSILPNEVIDKKPECAIGPKRLPTGAYVILDSPDDDRSSRNGVTNPSDHVPAISGYASGKKNLEHIAYSIDRTDRVCAASAGLEAGLECLFRVYGNLDVKSLVALRTGKTINLFDIDNNSIDYTFDYVFNRQLNHIEVQVIESGSQLRRVRELAPQYKINIFARKRSWFYQFVDVMRMTVNKFRYAKPGFGAWSASRKYPAMRIRRISIEFHCGSDENRSGLNPYKMMCDDNQKDYYSVASVLRRLVHESENPKHMLSIAAIDALLCTPDIFFDYFKSGNDSK